MLFPFLGLFIWRVSPVFLFSLPEVPFPLFGGIAEGYVRAQIALQIQLVRTALAPLMQ